jgi:hypothetical protein
MSGKWIAGIAAVIACAAFVGSSQAFAATQRYASPAGNGTACASASPCSLDTAVNSATNGDEIIIPPGDYSVSATLNLPPNGYAHGVHGQPAPRVHLGAHFLTTNGAGSRLSYVRIDGADQPLDVSNNTEADQLYVQGTAGNACLVYGTLIDSVCSTAASGGEAIAGGVSLSFTPILRNVTAWATGSGGIGIEYHASGGGSGHLTLTAVNVIAHGALADISAQATLPDTTTVNIDHSNFATQTLSGTGATINATATQTQPPLFANAAAGDFSEVPGSPTINAGVTSAANGPFDVLGLSRTIGGATDIGAYEFDPFKGVTLGTHKAKVKKRKAKVAIGCPADTPPPCAGTLELTYAGGHKTAGSAAFSIAAGATATVKVKISKKALKKLKRKGKLATLAAAAATDGAGRSVTTSGAIKLKG